MCKVLRHVTSFFKSVESFASMTAARETIDVVCICFFQFCRTSIVLLVDAQEAKTEKQWTEAD